MKNHLNFNKEKVKALLLENKISHAKLVKLLADEGVKISEQGVKFWFLKNGASKPDLKKAIALAKILNVSVNEILYSDELGEVFSENSNSLKVDVLEMRAGFGSEGVLDSDFKIERRLDLPPEFLGKVNAKYVKIIQCYGDSMMPEFNDGDFMLIEMLCGREYVKRPGLYLVRLGDIVYIKRIEFLPNNDIRLISINPAYQTFTASSTGYEWEILACVYGRINIKISNGFLFSDEGIK